MSDAPSCIDIRQVVDGLYAAILGRKADDVEWRPYGDHLMAGGAVEDVVKELLRSRECQLGFFRNLNFRHLLAPAPLAEDVRRLYLWHVPKTGGTSLREMLSDHFLLQERCEALTLSELYRLSPARLRSFRFISGHFGPVLPRLLSNVPLVTATLLREPVATIASLYNQLRTYGPRGDTPSELARTLSFDEWSRNNDTRVCWSNPQARFLALERATPPWPSERAAGEGEASLMPEDELYDVSLKCLVDINVVGTTTHLLDVYRESLCQMGMRPKRHDPLRLNVSPVDIGILPATRKWLLTQNSVDTALFQDAMRRGQELAKGQ